MSNEEIISNYLQTAYTDERLAALLAHAQDGKLAFDSCCCFIGIPTADHALRSSWGGSPRHYDEARRLPNAVAAEAAFAGLGVEGEGYDEEQEDVRARERLIPLILAEMDRRASLAEARNKLSLRITDAESHSQASQTEKVFA